MYACMHVHVCGPEAVNMTLQIFVVCVFLCQCFDSKHIDLVDTE